VAIISLLVSILLPSLSKAKELAKSAVCASNLKQVGTTIHFYLQDHEVLPFDDRVKSYGNFWSYFDNEQFVVNLLLPYVQPDYAHDSLKNHFTEDNHSRIFQCPNDPVEGTVGFERNSHGSSYVFTYNFEGQPLESPLNCICGNEWWDWHIEGQSVSESPLYSDHIWAVPGLHLGNYTVLFGDGHVEPINMDDRLDVYNYNAALKQ
jgi:prepilin-type processing-associated H-X9-DG protein